MPVETKVASGGVGAAIAGVIVWALQTYAFKGDVPGGLQPFLDVIVPAIVAWVFGWLAPHTPRPDDGQPSPRPVESAPQP